MFFYGTGRRLKARPEFPFCLKHLLGGICHPIGRVIRLDRGPAGSGLSLSGFFLQRVFLAGPGWPIRSCFCRCVSRFHRDAPPPPTPGGGGPGCARLPGCGCSLAPFFKYSFTGLHVGLSWRKTDCVVAGGRQGQRDSRCHGDEGRLPRRARPGLTVNPSNISRRRWAELLAPGCPSG